MCTQLQRGAWQKRDRPDCEGDSVCRGCESSECGLLEQQIRGAYDSFKEKNGHEPLFAQVYIHWDDIHSEEDYSNVTIKLNEEVIDEEDDDIMYYVNGFDELMSLCRYDDKNQTDFVIVGFEEFRDEL